MSALHSPSRAWTSAALAQDAIAERCKLAAAYATAASNLADAGDLGAMAHSLACAGRAIHAAIEAAQTLRPADGGGR
jgi:hypothetical protein